MQVVKLDAVKPDTTPRPLFTGPVSRQNLVAEDVGKGIRVSMINFSKGARTHMHTHTNEQVLYVISGKGVAGTESEHHEIGPGSVVYIPAGERHYHGASDGSAMSHLSIATPGKTEM
ncbi:MAG: cupin domain-containing protein [Chloroflexi bacterium]|nr:cupin domain-containing protein [Chloroflexota bacterium]